MGRIGEGFSGTTIKDTWTKPKEGGSRGGRWGWLAWEGVVGGKCGQLSLNNNKIIFRNFKKRRRGAVRTTGLCCNLRVPPRGLCNPLGV